MRNELNNLVSQVDDPTFKNAFDAEMQNFFVLFNRYLNDRARGAKL